MGKFLVGAGLSLVFTGFVCIVPDSRAAAAVMVGVFFTIFGAAAHKYK